MVPSPLRRFAGRQGRVSGSRASVIQDPGSVWRVFTPAGAGQCRRDGDARRPACLADPISIPERSSRLESSPGDTERSSPDSDERVRQRKGERGGGARERGRGRENLSTKIREVLRSRKKTCLARCRHASSCRPTGPERSRPRDPRDRA